MVNTINISIKSVNNFQQKNTEQFSNVKHLVFNRDNSEYAPSALGANCNWKSIDNCNSNSYRKYRKQKNNKKNLFDNESNDFISKKQMHTFVDNTVNYKNQTNRKKKKRKKNSRIKDQDCRAESVLECANPQIDSHTANYWNRNLNDVKNLQSSSSCKYGNISYKTKKKNHVKNRHWNSNKFKFNNMSSKSVYNHQLVSDDPQLKVSEKPDTDFFFFDISGSKSDNIENKPHFEKINNDMDCPLENMYNNTQVTKKRKHNHNKSNNFGEIKLRDNRNKTDSDISYNENNISVEMNTEHVLPCFKQAYRKTKKSQKKKRNSSISLNVTPEKNIFYKFPVTENKEIILDNRTNKHKNKSFADTLANLSERKSQIVDNSCSNSLKKKKTKTEKYNIQNNISDHEYSTSKNISVGSTENILGKVGNDIESSRKYPTNEHKFSKKKKDVNSQNKHNISSIISNSSEELCRHTKFKTTHKIRKRKRVEADLTYKCIKKKEASETDAERNINNLEYNNTSSVKDFQYVPIKDCKDNESESKEMHFYDEYKFSKTKTKKRKLSQNKNNVLDDTNSQEICTNDQHLRSDFKNMVLGEGCDRKQKQSISTTKKRKKKNHIYNIQETLNNLQKTSTSTSTEDDKSTGESNKNIFEGSPSCKIRKKDNKHCDDNDNILLYKKNNIYAIEGTLNNLQKTSTKNNKNNDEPSESASESAFEESTSFKIRTKKNKHSSAKDNILNCTKKQKRMREETGDVNNKIYERCKNFSYFEDKYFLDIVLKNDSDNSQDSCMYSSNEKIYERKNVNCHTVNSSNENSNLKHTKPSTKPHILKDDGIISDNLLDHTENCDMPLTLGLEIQPTSPENDLTDSEAVSEKKEFKILDDPVCTSKVGETPTSMSAENIKAENTKECKNHNPECTTERQEEKEIEKMEFEIFDDIIHKLDEDTTGTKEEDKNITSTLNESYNDVCDISDSEIIEYDENDSYEQEGKAECSAVNSNYSEQSDKKKIRRISVFTEYMQNLEGSESETEENELSKIEGCTDPEIIGDTVDMLRNLQVTLPFPISPLHALVTRTTTPTEKQLQEIQRLNISLKTGAFTKEEDDRIIHNWIQFCKEHDLKAIPSLFIKFPRRTKKETQLDILRYIGHGLDNRLLHRIYIRFKHLLQLQNLKLGRYTSEEDKAILKFMENTTSHRPFSDLAKLLNRTKLSVEKRYDLLKNNDNRKIHWTPAMVDRFIKTMMKITKCEKLKKLKHRKFTTEEWRNLSKQFDNIPVKKLQNAWKVTIYPRLFCKEVDLRSMKKEIIYILCDRNETDWKTVNWKEIAKNFKGFTANKIYMMIKKLTYFFVPKEKRNNLKECLEFLNEKFLKYRSIASTHKFKKFVFKEGQIVYDESTDSKIVKDIESMKETLCLPG